MVCGVGGVRGGGGCRGVSGLGFRVRSRVHGFEEKPRTPKPQKPFHSSEPEARNTFAFVGL